MSYTKALVIFGAFWLAWKFAVTVANNKRWERMHVPRRKR